MSVVYRSSLHWRHFTSTWDQAMTKIHWQFYGRLSVMWTSLLL